MFTKNDQHFRLNLNLLDVSGLQILDEEGQAIDSLKVTLPSKYVQAALVAAREEFE